MKLIDIEDEVLWKNLSEGRRSAKQVVKLFMKQPVIEAIPNEDCLKMERLVSMMIEDWRKENETNNI